MNVREVHTGSIAMKSKSWANPCLRVIKEQMKHQRTLPYTECQLVAGRDEADNYREIWYNYIKVSDDQSGFVLLAQEGVTDPKVLDCYRRIVDSCDLNDWANEYYEAVCAKLCPTGVERRNLRIIDPDLRIVREKGRLKPSAMVHIAVLEDRP